MYTYLKLKLKLKLKFRGRVRCSVDVQKETVQSSVSIGTVKTYAWLVTAAASSMSTSGWKV